MAKNKIRGEMGTEARVRYDIIMCTRLGGCCGWSPVGRFGRNSLKISRELFKGALGTTN